MEKERHRRSNSDEAKEDHESSKDGKLMNGRDLEGGERGLN